MREETGRSAGTMTEQPRAGVHPDIGALTGASALAEIVGSLLTLALVVACLMLLISAISWAVSHATGNARGAARGRVGVLVSLLGAAFAGGCVAWLTYLLQVGASL